MSSPGNKVWTKDVLSDKGFEDEQKFSNLMLLDAYVYGSFDVGDSDLQLRLGNQVVNWGESIFIQGINQINPIDVPAARRSGAEIKEILLPAWLAYANWGLSFGSVEAFYQFEWNNTSIDSCGTYWSVTSAIISTRAGVCNSATAFGNVLGTAAPGTASPLIAQYGSAPWLQANGLYVPLVKGKEPSNSGQFGLAFRFPIEKLDTEFGLYGMNIHSRIPVISSRAGTNPADLTATERAVLTGANIIGQDAAGYYYKVGTTNIRTPIPINVFSAAAAGQQVLGKPIVIESAGSYWEYPEDIQIFGLTTASNIAGWSVSSELSYTADQPVQVNGNDLLLGGFLLVGPERGGQQEDLRAGHWRLPAGLRPLRQDAVPGERAQDLQQHSRRREHADHRRGRCAVEQRARLHRRARCATAARSRGATARARRMRRRCRRRQGRPARRPSPGCRCRSRRARSTTRRRAAARTTAT